MDTNTIVSTKVKVTVMADIATEPLCVLLVDSSTRFQ